jgi:hypothetical protein
MEKKNIFPPESKQLEYERNPCLLLKTKELFQEKDSNSDDAITSENSNTSNKILYKNKDEIIFPFDLLYENKSIKNNHHSNSNKNIKNTNHQNNKSKPNISNEKKQKSLKNRTFNYSNSQSLKVFFETNTNDLISKVKTHQGSIYLQYLLEGLNDNDINKLLHILNEYLVDIMCNHYGNYFIKKLLFRLNYNQRIFIFHIIKNNFIDICSNKSGNYSIQSLIDVIQTPYEEEILKNFLCQNLFLLFTNENGQHVIQKIIIDFPERKREFLNNFLLNNIVRICCNLYGSLCTIKFIIMNNDIQIRLELIQNIKNNFNFLIFNSFGCSVLQFLLERFGVNYCGFIIKIISFNFVFFSTNNVILNFIEKIMNFIKKKSLKDFKEMGWIILKNDLLLTNLLYNNIGIKILIYFIQNFDFSQKNFLLIKINNNYFYKTNGISEQILKLLF